MPVPILSSPAQLSLCMLPERGRVVLRVCIYAHSRCYAKLTAKAVARQSIRTATNALLILLTYLYWAIENTPRRGSTRKRGAVTSSHLSR